MKPIWTKDANTAEEAQQCAEWITRIASTNLVDVDVLGYPTTRVIRAYQKESDGYKSTMYVPVQTAFVVESLAPEPNTEGIMEAASLKAVIGDVVSTAHKVGVREVYFLCTDENVIRLAERNGFERINLPLLRMKI